MDLLTGNIRTIYLRYLSAAFGSAMISSIYGWWTPPWWDSTRDRTAPPLWPYSRPSGTSFTAWGCSAGIGGSILFAAARGSRNDGTENRFFTAAVLLCAGFRRSAGG